MAIQGENFFVSLDGFLYLYRNQGTSSDGSPLFERAPFPIAGDPPRGQEVTANFAWGDYDTDGDLDIAVGDYGGNGAPLFFPPLRLYQNVDDSEAFARTDDGQLPAVDNSARKQQFGDLILSWGDVDNDGDPELVVPGAFDPSDAEGSLFPNSELYRNDDGELTQEQVISTRWPGPTSFGDVDNDGDLDLLITAGYPGFPGFNNDTTYVLRNDGGELVRSGFQIEDYSTITSGWADMDNDGDLDIVTTGSLGPDPPVNARELRIYENEEGSFTQVSLPGFEEDAFYVGLQLGDIDGDGDVDALVIGAFGVFRILSNEEGTLVDSGITFEAPGVSGFPNTIRTFRLADMDNDGDLDVLTSGPFVSHENRKFILYRNDLSQPNAAPSEPVAPASEVRGNEVMFAWSPATDDHTPSAALTYNLHVATTGGDIIFSSESLADGRRLLSKPGNASLNTSWTLRDLPDGEYEWRVQAIDNAFNGGAFAEGGSFMVGTVDTEGQAGLPTVFRADSAYPNPANAEAGISIDLPVAAEVRVSLYDVLGREVASVPAQALEAGTNQELKLDLSGLPSGVYLWRTEAIGVSGTERASGQLTVVR